MKKTFASILVFLLLCGMMPISLAASTIETTMREQNIYAVGNVMELLSYNGTPQRGAVYLYTGSSTSGTLTEYVFKSLKMQQI